MGAVEAVLREQAMTDEAARRVTPVITLPTVLTIHEMLSREFLPSEMLLSPWLASQSLSMIHAWRGTGKTHVALGVAYAVASGGTFLQWQAERPRSVLYIDGEMPGCRLKERLAAIVAANDKEPPSPEMLRIITPNAAQRNA